MNFYINNLTNYTYYKMEKVERIGQLNAKYDEIFPQYFEMLMRYKENPDDLENKKVFNYLQSNIKYIEKYLSLLQIIDGDEMDKALEKNNSKNPLVNELASVKKKLKEKIKITMAKKTITVKAIINKINKS